MNFVSLIISLVSGAIGGNVAGAAMKDKSLGVPGNSLSGFWAAASAARSCNCLELAAAKPARSTSRQFWKTSPAAASVEGSC